MVEEEGKAEVINEVVVLFRVGEVVIVDVVRGEVVVVVGGEVVAPAVVEWIAADAVVADALPVVMESKSPVS